MNQFEIKLLRLAYENYLKTGNIYYELLPRGGDELMYFTDAAESLSELGYILPLSENIGASSIDVTPSNLVISYELTNLGLRYIKENLKTINPDET